MDEPGAVDPVAPGDGGPLRALLDSLLDPHMTLTAMRGPRGVTDFRIDDVNDACDQLGLARDAIGRTILGLFPGLVAAGLLQQFIDVLETGVPLVLDEMGYPNELLGEMRWYDVRAVRMDDSLVFTLRDVTARRVAAARLAESEQRYRLLVENAWDVIWTMSVDSTITYVSPSVERMRGFTPAEAAAQPLHEAHPPATAAKVAEYFARLTASIAKGAAPPAYRGEHEYYRKDGSIMFGEMQVIPQVDEHGTVVQILGVTRDVSDRRRFERELGRLAVTDPLTGVWNRRHGEQLFRADLDDSRAGGPPLSLLLLDIDHFKSINDTYGHAVGDLVLIEIARRLGATLRTSDVLARWGGEEFVMMLRDCTIGDAAVVADLLRAVLADTPFEHVGTVTASIGVSALQPEDTFASWVDRADRAMYSAKTEGRNMVRLG